MIKRLPESSGSAIGYRISGKVSEADEGQWVSEIEHEIQNHEGPLNVLVHLDDDASWGVKAGLKDLNWATRHARDFKKCAIVTDRRLWKNMVGIDRPLAKLFGVSEKHFSTTELDTAWDWLREH